ncbi:MULTISPECIES: hypothetical protein [Pseudoalteromonas]|uniref:hypothetical protein n=1 Tax=Pseudoalteromonas TaxID=53246 RepID=UPI000FFF1406|nr:MULTISPECIES: hypothetical protein [Pseudoalteromonas]MCG9758479.1 hypothetical protein [Pseudoalteromonas sp. Isolate6]NKC19760.1 hypothetical protein [Pseudoalteromonas galatheae]RXE86913.1 hypothetical protein DRB05_09970 [Pseudoalteromonas sp. A757]
MLRRRRNHQFKRNTKYTSPNRRRVMMKNAHRKMLLRHRIFALIQMEEQRDAKAATAVVQP